MNKLFAATATALLLAFGQPASACETVNVFVEGDNVSVEVICPPIDPSPAPYAAQDVAGWVYLGSNWNSWEKQNFAWSGYFPSIGSAITAITDVNIREDYNKPNPWTGVRQNAQKIGLARQGQTFFVEEIVDAGSGHYWALVY